LMNYRNVALLLDSAPPTWTSQEDRHFRLCLRTSRPDYRPVERSSGWSATHGGSCTTIGNCGNSWRRTP